MNISEFESLLLSLLKGEHSSLHLTFNDMNGMNYQTVEEFIMEDSSATASAEWISSEEKAKAIKNNSMWSLQWYPNTPVGSYDVSASSLEPLIDHVIKHKNEYD